MENVFSDQKISEALELLNQAAKEKRDELAKLVEEKYSYVKSAFSDTSDGARRTAEQARTAAEDVLHAGEARLRGTASTVDRSVRENPWAYLSGVAIVCALAGYVLGSRE